MLEDITKREQQCVSQAALIVTLEAEKRQLASQLAARRAILRRNLEQQQQQQQHESEALKAVGCPPGEGDRQQQHLASASKQPPQHHHSFGRGEWYVEAANRGGGGLGGGVYLGQAPEAARGAGNAEAAQERCSASRGSAVAIEISSTSDGIPRRRVLNDEVVDAHEVHLHLPFFLLLSLPLSLSPSLITR